MEQELAKAKDKIQSLESRLAEATQKTKIVNMAQAFLHEITATLTYIKAPIEFLNRFYLKELKNIYGTIEQHLSDAERTKFLKNFDSIDKNLKAILTGSEKIRTMTEFSKGTLASEENAHGNVYLSFVLDSAKESGGIPGTGCAFDVDMPDGFIVWGNSILLERVFANLITNSLEAMSGQKDKEITLRCSYQELNGAKAAYFEYSDSGPGIPSHLRETVFRQGVSTKNSGHGLHVCREIIEGFHGGKIDIQDDANKKSKFVFWFPFANADKTIDSDKGNGIHSETEKPLGPNKGNKHAVLIIEDYKDIREILEEKFEEWDLEVSCAKNVEEAQKIIGQREWKIAFVNMRLPSQIRGIDLIKVIRLRWPKTIIFAMSGDRDKNLEQEALAAGAIDYLTKPDDLRMDVFDGKIRSLLEKDAAF